MWIVDECCFVGCPEDDLSVSCATCHYLLCLGIDLYSYLVLVRPCNRPSLRRRLYLLPSSIPKLASTSTDNLPFPYFHLLFEKGAKRSEKLSLYKRRSTRKLRGRRPEKNFWSRTINSSNKIVKVDQSYMLMTG